jgi:hypothetical protein
MSGPRGANPLSPTDPAVPAYREAYASAKQAMLVVGNVRRDVTQVDLAVEQLDDAKARLLAFKAKLAPSAPAAVGAHKPKRKRGQGR